MDFLSSRILSTLDEYDIRRRKGILLILSSYLVLKGTIVSGIILGLLFSWIGLFIYFAILLVIYKIPHYSRAGLMIMFGIVWILVALISTGLLPFMQYLALSIICIALTALLFPQMMKIAFEWTIVE